MTMNDIGRRIVLVLLLASGAVLVGVPLFVTPRFSGSLTGSLFGIAGAVMMVLSFSYIVLKRVRGKLFGLRRMQASRLLQIHVAFGMVAGAFVIFHTGNLVRSPMGFALLLTLSGILATGAIGRYQLRRLSDELRVNEEQLLTLRKHLEMAEVDPRDLDHDAAQPATRIASAIADLEAADQIGGTLKAAFRRWTIVHVLLSIFLLAILVLHIASVFYLGLRWWP